MSEMTKNKPQTPGSIRSKHRLAEISHHFLSDKDARSPAWKNTTFIPILLSSKQDDYIVYQLNHSFNRHDDSQKSSSMVLNIESQINASDNDIDENGMPDYCLVPVTSPPTTMALQCDRFIIAVHASLSGVRIAYDQLAFMASLETDFNVCVIMLNAKNIQDGKRFFGFLCENAHSLLALELECGGFLLQEGNNISPNNHAPGTSPPTDDIATDFDSVASKILREFTPTTQAVLATPLSAPVGVAGLLS